MLLIFFILEYMNKTSEKKLLFIELWSKTVNWVELKLFSTNGLNQECVICINVTVIIHIEQFLSQLETATW